MNTRFPAYASAFLALALMTAAAPAQQAAAVGGTRQEIDLAADWLFFPKDIPDGKSVTLNESRFDRVCLPHTNRIVRHSGIDTASFAFVSWYRRHFKIPEEYAGRRFIMEFQAVSKAAEVFVNGERIGEHKGAYTPFSLDITGKVKAGCDNVVAVRVDSRQRKDIPPEGINVDYMIFGGIVRNVRLTVADPLHSEWVYARQDSGRPQCAAVRVKAINQYRERKRYDLVIDILDSAGAVVATAERDAEMPADSCDEIQLVAGPIPGLRLWSPDSPYLYTARVRLRLGEKSIDEYQQRFGMRSILFSRTDGSFSMNDKRLKLRGLNRHETFPFIGRAAADRLQRKDADILKYDLGCNIVRCSHYPQSPAFLDRCDEIGLMVLEEMPGWMFVSEKPSWQAVALKNVEEMVLRDRSHPSIISFGVRINESADFHELYARTNRIARMLDPGRPTHGVRVQGRGSLREFLEDVWIFNYSVPFGVPQVMPWITGEHAGHRVAVRSGDDETKLVNQMLAHAAVLDSAYANPKVAGILGWCAFDYNSPYRCYAVNSVCYHGVADIFRLPKHAAWLYRSQSDPSQGGPMVYIADRWEKPGKPKSVWVASNCEKVELFVNGVSKGRRSPSRFLSLPHPLFVWDSLRFEPGELKAVGYLHDSAAAEARRKTPGPPVRLSIIPDDTVLSAGGDMTRVVIAAVDAGNQTVPYTVAAVMISVSGAGDFIGESPVLLEGGRTAFFVKTDAHKTGAIICRARCQNIPEVAASIIVTGR